MSSLHSRDHDHSVCLETALAAAERLCAERKVRLTAQRREVLELVLGGHKSVGAYDLVEMMSRDGQRTAPQTVYRALDFLIGQGLIHRLASLNAYVGCSHPGHAHAGQFLICTNCRDVAELGEAGLESRLTALAADRGFAAHAVSVELTGLCAACRAAGAA